MKCFLNLSLSRFKARFNTINEAAYEVNRTYNIKTYNNSTRRRRLD